MIQDTSTVDVLVIGGGIAGLQAAIDLGNLGLRVAVVERQPSIGGKMIGLSKVFPTLDCCSCICTPRMAEAEHHANITTLTYAEVQRVQREGSGFLVDVLKKPRYVNEETCTGCRLCEYACDVELPHEFEGGFGARKAVYVPFGNAVPQVAVLDMDNCLLCGRCEKLARWERSITCSSRKPSRCGPGRSSSRPATRCCPRTSSSITAPGRCATS